MREKSQRKASKSVVRDELAVENKIAAAETQGGPKQIFGLGGEMALAAAGSKKAQQRLKKKLNAQH